MSFKALDNTYSPESPYFLQKVTRTSFSSSIEVTYPIHVTVTLSYDKLHYIKLPSTGFILASKIGRKTFSLSRLRNVMTTALGHIYTFEIFQILINGGNRNKRSWLFKKSKINKRPPPPPPPRILGTGEYRSKSHKNSRILMTLCTH